VVESVCVVCVCQAALGLSVNDELPVVNSSAGSRLWQWSGRACADNDDDTQHLTNSDSAATTQHDGILCVIATAVANDWLGVWY